MASFIEPRILKGFRDFLPPQEIARRSLIETIEGSFRSFGFVPIDTPALEYADILLGKGGGETEKQIYRFKDNGDRDVALRFDLTVPFARFVALYQHELSLPFKRYHIAKVWRGENTQRGRYREFTQCDFDIVGSKSPAADFEILLVMRDTFKVIGAEVTIHLNHRGLFNKFLTHINVVDRSVEILRTVDKLAKIGEGETRKLLAEIAGEDGAAKILRFINCKGSYDEILKEITELSGGPSTESRRLEILRSYMNDTGTTDSFVLDPSITRGLDYYTGIVYETFLKEDPSIGSVCSGGRYDNLAGLYSKDQVQISGVGSSIGLDRLVAALEHLGKLKERPSYAALAIAVRGEEDAGRCQALAARFRSEGIPCEVLLNTEATRTDNSKAAEGKAVDSSKATDNSKAAEGKALTRQFIQAEKKGARWVIIPGEGSGFSGKTGEAAETGEAGQATGITLRDLSTRQNQENLSVQDVIKLVGKV
ncbi:MAG: histidine--tRNA ligase [Treponema sp.]|jgi:histidyl-tRNA synthetase|nr:histidine--tRNA ligase [Treponema sp.]